MDTKRYILAIGLSMLVLMAYMRFFAPQPIEVPAAPEQQAAATKDKEPATETPKAVPASVAKKIAVASTGKDIVIETDVVKAVVNTAGGVITHWELKGFREADKTEVGVMPTFRRIMGGQKKEAKPEKELGNVQLFTQIG